MLNWQTVKKKILKLAFKIYADLEIILVPEDNGKQNPNEFYTNKSKKHLVCSSDYKLVYVGDKFISYLGKDAVYNFLSSRIGKGKYFSDVTKNHFNK